jgi:hypothetical protein
MNTHVVEPLNFSDGIDGIDGIEEVNAMVTRRCTQSFARCSVMRTQDVESSDVSNTLKTKLLIQSYRS